MPQITPTNYPNAGTLLPQDALYLSRTPYGVGDSLTTTPNNIAKFLYGIEVVTVSTTLVNPMPNIVIYNFTTPGQVITLAAANVAGVSQPAGKPIYFVPAATSTQNFDINTADGNTYDTVIGQVYFSLTYGSNSNLNGTPIYNQSYVNAGALGDMAYQDANAVAVTGGTLTGVSVVLVQDAITGLEAVTYQQLTDSPTISGTTHTLASSDSMRFNNVSNVAGCTITVDFGSLAIGEWAYFQKGFATGVITFVEGTGVLYSTPASCFKVAVDNGGAWIFRNADGAYYLHGELTA